MSLQGRAFSQCQNLDRSRSVEALPHPTAERGEVRLALAILADAVRCLKESQDAWNFPPRLFRWEAEQWIESRDRGPHFSFENICSILNLDAHDLRVQILRWRAQPCRQSARPFVRSAHVGQRIPAHRGGSRRPSTGMTGVHSTRGMRPDSARGE